MVGQGIAFESFPAWAVSERAKFDETDPETPKSVPLTNPVVMAEEAPEEIPMPAEEHAMPRPNPKDVGPLMRARLPSVFLSGADTDEELAVRFAKMGGFHLELGARAEVNIYPVVGQATLNDLVAKNKDSAAFMTKFQAGPAKQCLEIAVLVSGQHTRAIIPDISVREEVPLRLSSRGATTNSRTFFNGGLIEVSKTFKCDSIGGQNLKKFYMANCSAFLFRFRLPFNKGNGKIKTQTFKASSLAAFHLGATGSGMSVRLPSPSSFCSCFVETSLKDLPKLVAGAPHVWVFWL